MTRFLCRPTRQQLTPEDLQAVAEFGDWLKAQHAKPTPPVRRPQACNCGANKLIAVACWERCKSRQETHQ
jgi:hypothetical protein